MAKYTGVVGLIAIVLAAFLFSTKRSAIQKRVVIWGMVLQFAFALLVLKSPIGKGFYAISLFVNAVLNYSSAGARFVFGDKLGLKNDQFGVIFAFQVLPIVIFICSVFAVLY
jgi:concentrative nucleoside transporter, CNT family